MSMSASATICYGYVFEEEYEFPWDEHCEKDWYLNETGFFEKNKHINPFNEEGDYKPGVDENSPLIKQYFDARKRHAEEFKLPFELVSCCHFNYTTFILATLSSIQYASNYPPSKIELPLSVDTTELALLDAFIEKYGLKPEQGPVWLLSAFYG